MRLMPMRPRLEARRRQWQMETMGKPRSRDGGRLQQRRAPSLLGPAGHPQMAVVSALLGGAFELGV